jgi:hypothetical protein
MTAAEATLNGISEPTNEEEAASVGRAQAGVSAIRAALISASPQLVAQRTLDPVVNSAVQVRDSASAFSTTADPAHLVTLHDHLDVILAAMGMGAFFSPDVVDAMRDNLTRYRRAGRVLIAGAEADVERLEQKATKTNEALDALGVRIGEEVERVGADVVSRIAPFESRVNEVSTKLAAEGAKIDALVDSSSKNFQDSLTSWQSDHEKALEAAGSQTAEALKDVASKAESQRNGLKRSASDVIETLNDHERKAREVVSTIGAIAITGGFGEYAHQQRHRADIWSVVTILALVVASVPGIWYFLSVTFAGQQAVSLERFVERVLTGVPLYVIAGYAAVQGARARDNERRARAKELELAALGPYLANLEDPKQRDAAIVALANRYFGDLSAPTVGNEGISTSPVIKAVEEAGAKGP